MGALVFPVAEDVRLRLWTLFDIAGPFLGREFRVGTNDLRLSGGSVSLGPGGISPAVLGASSPRASYQWLLFETLDGSQPKGPTTFEFAGPPIGFVGAITEVDVVSSDPGTDWRMQISVDGQGSIFQSSQSSEILPEAGFFRPTPPGFWPETEGLTFPLPAPGLVPRIKVFRSTKKPKNLTLRVLIVAHPSF